MCARKNIKNAPRMRIKSVGFLEGIFLPIQMQLCSLKSIHQLPLAAFYKWGCKMSVLSHHPLLGYSDPICRFRCCVHRGISAEPQKAKFHQHLSPAESQLRMWLLPNPMYRNNYHQLCIHRYSGMDLLNMHLNIPYSSVWHGI